MAVQLVVPRFHRIVRFEIHRGLDLGDHRVEGGVDLVRRALIAQHQAGIAGQSPGEFAQNAALADPGLAGDQHHLSLTAPGAVPAIEQQPDLVLFLLQYKKS